MSSASLSIAIATVRRIDQQIKLISQDIIDLQNKTAKVENMDQFKVVEASFQILRARLETLSAQRTIALDLVQKLSASNANLNYVEPCPSSFDVLP